MCHGLLAGVNVNKRLLIVLCAINNGAGEAFFTEHHIISSDSKLDIGNQSDDDQDHFHKTVFS